MGGVAKKPAKERPFSNEISRFILAPRHWTAQGLAKEIARLFCNRPQELTLIVRGLPANASKWAKYLQRFPMENLRTLYYQTVEREGNKIPRRNAAGFDSTGAVTVTRPILK